LGDSFLLREGDEWYKLRKMFNPAFSQAHLETLVPQMTEEIMIFVDKLEKASTDGTTVILGKELTVNLTP